MPYITEITITSTCQLQSTIAKINHQDGIKKHIINGCPYSLLNPSRSAYQHLKDMYPRWSPKDIKQALSLVGFPSSHLQTPSALLSGGQAQLLTIALAINTAHQGLILVDPFASIAENRIPNLMNTIKLHAKKQPIWLITYSQASTQTSILPPSCKPLLAIHNLSVARHNKTIFKLSLSVHQQEMLGITGDNGSGKSTLAQTIMQTLPYQGDMYFNGQRLCQKLIKDRAIQMLFQNGLFNPLVPLKHLLSENLDQGIFQKCLEAFSINGLWQDQYPQEIDPTTLKSIALARLLARKPTMVILDEPFAAMPNSWIQICMSLLQQYQLTALIIEHNISILESFCHRVHRLEKGSLQ